MRQATRTALELIALQEIRSFPGGELVISVALEIDDVPPESDWHLIVTAAEGADIDRIDYAAQTTTKRLKRHYVLQRH